MKTLLGILLLANVALLLWGMGQREFLNDRDMPDAEFHPELMELLPAEKSVPLATVTIKASGEVVTTAAEQAMVQQQLPAPGQPATEPGTTTDSTTSESAKPVIETIPEQQVPMPGQCMYIGPYTTELDRSRAGRQLQDMKIAFSDREDPEGKVLGYRVYQGPFSSAQDLSRAKRRLEKQGVKDLYLMNEDKKRSFISLGFFSNQDSANEQNRKFARKNIKTKQRLEYAIYYWLQIADVQSIAKLNEKSAIPLPKGIKKVMQSCSELP